MIVKSVAAFANAQGGTLLIGVKDDGEILGLERDYTALGGADRDKFERHLRDVLSASLGEAFAASRLKVIFPTVDGIEICRVDVSSAHKPIFVAVADKNGQPAEKFYVRNGNSSREMSASETHSYIADRFSQQSRFATAARGTHSSRRSLL